MTLCSPLNKMSNPTMSVTGTSQDQIHKWMMQFDRSSAKTLLERVQKVYEDKIWFLKDSEDSDGKTACTCSACRKGIVPLKVTAVYQTFLLHQSLMLKKPSVQFFGRVVDDWTVTKFEEC